MQNFVRLPVEARKSFLKILQFRKNNNLSISKIFSNDGVKKVLNYDFINAKCQIEKGESHLHILHEKLASLNAVVFNKKI